MTQAKALIVDDEPDIRELLEITLSRMDVDAHSAQNLEEAFAELKSSPFALCLADMRLPDGNGIDLVKHIARDYPQTPVAVITAHGNMETAIEALKAGAFDFVSKPVDLPVLRQLVDTALKLPKQDTQTSCGTETEEDCPLRGNSQPMKAIRAMIRKLGRSQAPVYISGESGTGKELAARLIHESSPRRTQAFVAVNCGAIPHELMESELFGHVKGSFTGAISDKEGLFEAAQGGTLFLDEVADLPLSMQVKLLRVVQEKTIRRVGSAQETKIDVRVISATHKNLEDMIKSGDFRQDLYYRLNVIELRMPPLRDRREDISPLIEHLLTRISSDYGQPTPKLEPAAFQALQEHSYPGNVRELENTLERAFALCDDGLILVRDLGLSLHSFSAEQEPTPQMQADEGLEDYLSRIERDVLTRVLEETRWNKTAAAKKLGISFRALRYRLSKLGLDSE